MIHRIFTALFILFFWIAESHAQGSKKPNVLFIAIDVFSFRLAMQWLGDIQWPTSKSHSGHTRRSVHRTSQPEADSSIGIVR